MVKNKKEISTLTKAEMEIMNILWEEAKPMSTHAIIEQYPEPKPAYSTIATFMVLIMRVAPNATAPDLYITWSFL